MPASTVTTYAPPPYSSVRSRRSPTLPTPTPSQPIASSSTLPRPPRRRSTDKEAIKKPKQCAGCFKPIKGGYMVGLDQQAYHRGCFKCADCGKVFGESDTFNRYVHDDKAFAMCPKDYFRRLHGLCHDCQSPFEPGSLIWRIDATGNNYHPEHYRCKVCKKEVARDDPIAVFEGELYCHYHLALKSLACTACGEAIYAIDSTRPDPLEPQRKMHKDCDKISRKWDIRLVTYLNGRAKSNRSSLPEAEYVAYETQIKELRSALANSVDKFHRSAEVCIGASAHYLEQSTSNGDWKDSLRFAIRFNDHLELLRAHLSDVSFSRQHQAVCKDKVIDLENIFVRQLLYRVVEGQKEAAYARQDHQRAVIEHRLEEYTKSTTDSLMRAILDGALARLIQDKNPAAWKDLLARLDTFYFEPARNFTSSRAARYSLTITNASPALSSNMLLPPISPPTSFLSELSDTPSDLFYHYSGKGGKERTLIPLANLCEDIAESSVSGVRTIPSIRWHKEGGLLRHEYLLVQVQTPGKEDFWLRLERAAKHRGIDLRGGLGSFISQLPPDDGARMARTVSTLSDEREIKKPYSILHFRRSQPSLARLGNLLQALLQASPTYSLYKENCWFFCSTVVELLVQEYHGSFDTGYRLEHEELGRKERGAVRDRWREIER